MSGFVLHPDAFNDLLEIWDFIAADNSPAADATIEKLFGSFRSLAEFPKLGRVRPDLSSRPLRFLVIGEFIIAYAPIENRVAIIAVLHGRRSPRIIAALLRERD